MKKNVVIGIACASLVLIGALIYDFLPRSVSRKVIVKSKHDIVALFPTSVGEIKNLVEDTKKQAQKGIDELLALSAVQRTFENTAQALDRITLLNFSTTNHILTVLSMVSPEKELRDAATQGLQELSEFSIHMFQMNKELYNAFKEYAEGNALHENLTSVQRYFVDETMKGFKKSGLHLPQEQQDRIKKIEKQLSDLGMDFQNAINADTKKIEVSKEELVGMDDDFINGLEHAESGKYILTTAYPVYFPIMEHCSIEATRKKMFKAFISRAYPENLERLHTIIALRDELARLLGYDSYAALNIDDEMIQTPARAQEFLESLAQKASVKLVKEVEEFKRHLPDGISLNSDGTIKPWDLAYIKTYVKKKLYDVDDREIAQYFPMEHTVKELLAIYESFFDITLKETPVSGLWDPSVKLIEVYKKDSQEPYGYLLLDLFPRPNKYGHACEIDIIRGIQSDSLKIPVVAVVLANLSPSTKEKPSLLKLSEVKTFFHEFGHALHEILGATPLASFSGTNVKMDFVEMPSQMLEEWLWDADILAKLSRHYQTGKSLPRDLIDRIIASKRFGSGMFVMTQLVYSNMSLGYYGPGATKNTLAMMSDFKKTLLPQIAVDQEDYMPANFDHLIGYGARYYGYLFSKVYALDLFDTIKQHGLLNPEIGRKYRDTIIAKGGSKDPNELLEDFLGREPSQEAFIRDLGL